MAKLPIMIIYAADQERSKTFYESVLGEKAVLHVPGMTEFQINEKLLLGIMPENGIAKILGDKTIHPGKGNGIPRCELYLPVDDPEKYLNRAVQVGAKMISLPEMRTWGDVVAYCSDPDGHIIAFAKY